jgi:hypothetical protein
MGPVHKPQCLDKNRRCYERMHPSQYFTVIMIIIIIIVILIIIRIIISYCRGTRNIHTREQTHPHVRTHRLTNTSTNTSTNTCVRRVVRMQASLSNPHECANSIVTSKR